MQIGTMAVIRPPRSGAPGRCETLIPGVAAIKVDLDKKTATVKFDPDRANETDRHYSVSGLTRSG
jgi:hypothetical protein